MRSRLLVANFAALILGSVIAGLSGCSSAPTVYEIPDLQTDRSSEYEQQLKKLHDRDPELDFSKLRWAYHSSTHYRAWDTQEHEAGIAMFNAFEDGNHELCIKFAEAILERNYTSLGGHIGAFGCYSATENAAKAALHRYVISGLVESIEKSGDGSTPETAFVTISPNEMRSYLQVKGYTSYRQELVEHGSRYIERIFVIDRATEEHSVVYFDNTASLLDIDLKPPSAPKLN